MAETRRIGKMIIHFQGDNAAQLAKSFDGSFAGSPSFQDAMNETARTQRHIYVGSSLDDLRDQPGFDHAGFNPNSWQARSTSAYGRPSGADSYFVVVTDKAHHLILNGQTFPGSTDLSLVHELLHPSQIMRTIAEVGKTETQESEGRVQMREQKIAQELGKVPGKDFPDVLESGPYTVQLDPNETQPGSTLPSNPALLVDPMKYEGGVQTNPGSQPHSEAPIGIFSGKPMRFFGAPIFDTRTPSSPLDDLIWNGARFRAPTLDAGAGAPLAPALQNSFDPQSSVSSPAISAGDVAPSVPSSQDSHGPLSLSGAYLEYLKRLNASQAQ